MPEYEVLYAAVMLLVLHGRVEESLNVRCDRKYIDISDHSELFGTCYLIKNKSYAERYRGRSDCICVSKT